MPTLSMFYGIIIRMQREKAGKHHMPHIHAICSDDEAVIELNGTVLEGNLPPAKMKLVQAWMEIHKEDLQADWRLLNEGDEFFKIEPLK